MKKIYLDYAATTPVDDRVIKVMLPYIKEVFGNPSSLHGHGQKADAALDNARRGIADNLGAKPSEIIFTSCGSESDNLALRGIALARKEKYGFNQIVISPIEHPAVEATAEQLEKYYGFKVDFLPVNNHGEVEYEQVDSVLSDQTALVSIMGANNEIGTLNNLNRVSAICRQYQIPLHTDAVQSAAHYPPDVDQVGIDLLSLGAHKFYGPKGVGVLYLRSGTELIPSMTGGSQEFGLRAATQNIPLIVGMAEAYQLVHEEGLERQKHTSNLRDQIIKQVLDTISGSQLTGAKPENRLPNHASFVFEGVDGNLLIQVLDSEGFACSSGSACKTGDPKPSKVLTHLGYPPALALGSLRVTVGKSTTSDEVSQFLDVLPECVERVRQAA